MGVKRVSVFNEEFSQTLCIRIAVYFGRRCVGRIEVGLDCLAVFCKEIAYQSSLAYTQLYQHRVLR